MNDAVRIIKKYPNRRLYDTVTSSYITLAEVKSLVLSQALFQVVDAKTNQDITRSILLQIILEEEGTQGAPMFSSEMLAQVIRLYGHAMQGVMGAYLEKSIHAFIEVQKRMQDQARALYGETPKLNSDLWAQFWTAQGPAVQGLMGSYLEQSAQTFLEVQEQMRKQAMNLFSGFPYAAAGHPEGGEAPVASAADTAATDPDHERKKTTQAAKAAKAAKAGKATRNN